MVTFDNATGEGVIARFKDGSIRRYGGASMGVEKLWLTIDSIRRGSSTCCGIEAAAAQTHLMMAVQQSDILTFPASLVSVEEIGGGQSTVVKGLEDCLFRCYHESKLPSALGMK